LRGKQHLPRLARGAANAAISGGIHFDTFGGRKWEWEHAENEYVCSVLDAEQKHLVCQKHKTSKTDGGLAKKLTPGIFEALRWYRKLPRPEGCQTFLVPVSDKAATVSIPKCLKTFCARHLKGCAIRPTTNLTREWFHCVLMTLTKDAEKLKDMMVKSDAHSKKVMDKHYILKGPEDDVVLAEALIETVLGKTVPFPSEEEVEAHFQANDE
jgi:hypothetical protein